MIERISVDPMKRLVDVGKVGEIEVIDHVIISKNGYFSLQAEGMLK